MVLGDWISQNIDVTHCVGMVDVLKLAMTYVAFRGVASQ